MGGKTETIGVNKITDLPSGTVLQEVRVSYTSLELSNNGLRLDREGQIVLPWAMVIDGILCKVDRQGNGGDGDCEVIKADIEKITFVKKK